MPFVRLWDCYNNISHGQNHIRRVNRKVKKLNQETTY